MTKKILLLLVLFVSTLLAGCGRNEGMVDNRAERNRRLAVIMDMNERQIVDDWDEFWLVDQNCKLTGWSVYIGD